MLSIQNIEVTDAPAFNLLLKKIESESHYMLHDPGERNTSDEDQKNFIERILNNPRSKIFVSKNNEQLVGFIIIIGEGLKKKAHSRYLAMGVLAEFKGMKIGTQLMKAAVDFCDSQKVSRIELTVVATNLIAVNLYHKFGFKIEGTKQRSLTILGEEVDELYMARIIATRPQSRM